MSDTTGDDSSNADGNQKKIKNGVEDSPHSGIVQAINQNNFEPTKIEMREKYKFYPGPG